MDPRKFLRMSSISYAAMTFVGFEICWWWHQNVQTLFASPIARPLDALLITVSGIGFLILGQKLMETHLPSYRYFRQTLAGLLGQFSLAESFWLAFCSAVGEEVLFRGAIQPFLGVWFTSLLFGALHLDPEGGVSSWTLWAMVAGLIMGGSVLAIGSIWPAIAIHFLVNLIGMRSLARQFQRRREA
jgi:membrane protease YdiL (CAAX protease family)